MKDWLAKNIRDNLKEYLQADLRVARLLGAPKAFTLSGWAYKLEQEGNAWGAFWRKLIDKIFLWLWKQSNHCAQAYQEDLERSNA